MALREWGWRVWVACGVWRAASGEWRVAYGAPGGHVEVFDVPFRVSERWPVSGRTGGVCEVWRAGYCSTSSSRRSAGVGLLGALWPTSLTVAGEAKDERAVAAAHRRHVVVHGRRYHAHAQERGDRGAVALDRHADCPVDSVLLRELDGPALEDCEAQPERYCGREAEGEEGGGGGQKDGGRKVVDALGDEDGAGRREQPDGRAERDDERRHHHEDEDHHAGRQLEEGIADGVQRGDKVARGCQQRQGDERPDDLRSGSGGRQASAALVVAMRVPPAVEDHNMAAMGGILIWSCATVAVANECVTVQSSAL